MLRPPFTYLSLPTVSTFQTIQNSRTPKTPGFSEVRYFMNC